MATATFAKGEPIIVDYTPETAVAAGDVLVVGEAILIAHLEITAGRLGHPAAGGGLYDMPKEAGGGVTFDAFVSVYWDETAETCVATSDGGANNRIGLAAEAAADAESSVRVMHVPN